MTRSTTKLYFRLRTPAPQVLEDQVTGMLEIHFSSRYRKERRTHNGVEVLARRSNPPSTFSLLLPREFLHRPFSALRECLRDCFTSRRLDINPRHFHAVADRIAMNFLASYPSRGMGYHMGVEMHYLHVEQVDEGTGVSETPSANDVDSAPTGDGTGGSKTPIEKLIENGGFVASESDQELGTCSICLEEFSSSAETQLLRIDCSHVYHRSCLLPWLEKRTTCPYCRRQLPL